MSAFVSFWLEDGILVLVFFSTLFLAGAGLAWGNREGLLGFFSLCLGLLIFVLIIGIVNGRAKGTVTADDHAILFAKLLTPGVIYDTLGTMAVGNRFIVILQEEGTKEPRAYWFDKVPPKRFKKMGPNHNLLYQEIQDGEK